MRLINETPVLFRVNLTLSLKYSQINHKSRLDHGVCVQVKVHFLLQNHGIYTAHDPHVFTLWCFGGRPEGRVGIFSKSALLWLVSLLIIHQRITLPPAEKTSLDNPQLFALNLYVCKAPKANLKWHFKLCVSYSLTSIRVFNSSKQLWNHDLQHKHPEQLTS